MKLNTALLCDFAQMGPDGKANAMGIFHTMYAPAVPADLPPFFIYVDLDFETEKPDSVGFRIRLVDETQDVILDANALVQLQRISALPPSGNATIILQIAGLRVSQFGRISTSLFIDDQELEGPALTIAKPLEATNAKP